MTIINNPCRALRNSFYFIFSALIMTACSGGGDSGGSTIDPTNQPNPEFVAKVEAVSINQIRLFPGHLKSAELVGSRELVASDAESGDLITIDVEFEIAGELTGYSLNAQLVPQSIYKLFSPGNTIGEIFAKATDQVQAENMIDFGAVYINAVTPGVMRAVIHGKLPVLETSGTFKVAVMPSLSYFSAGKGFASDDLNSMPMLVDDSVLIVKQLAQVKAELVKIPDLVAGNDFTALEAGAAFDANGFSVEPIFQSSANINLSTFNDQEVIVVTLNWNDSKGNTYPLGLLSSKAGGATPIIRTEARFTVNKQSGSSSMTIPISAHAQSNLYSILLTLSTDIQLIADKDPLPANFTLNVATADSINTVTAGIDYNLSIPLVSQVFRSFENVPTDFTKFTVLRAGTTNTNCVGIGIVIEGVAVAVDSVIPLLGMDCNIVSDELYWRYDPSTKQVIFKIRDANNDQYCLSARYNGVFQGSLELRKCSYRVFEPNLSSNSQTFVFKDQKLVVDDGIYSITWDAVNNKTQLSTNLVDGTDFFRDSNGLNVDSKGRIFSAGKEYSKSWGDADIAQIRLAFGGDSYVEYMPVIGATAKGQAELTASMLGKSADLIKVSFIAQRYLNKRLSITSNNYPDKVVGDGAELVIDIAGKLIKKYGKHTPKTVDGSLNIAFDSIGSLLEGADLPISIKPSAAELTYDMDQTFIDVTFVVFTVPVNIVGGVTGQFAFNSAIETIEERDSITQSVDRIGISVSANEVLYLSAYLEAKLDAVVIKGGVNAELELITQTISFSTTGGFFAQGALSINYFMTTSLDANLRVLKGDITGFVEYYVPAFAAPPWKLARKDFTIFSTDYLYNKQWSIFKLDLTEANAVELLL